MIKKIINLISRLLRKPKSGSCGWCGVGQIQQHKFLKMTVKACDNCNHVEAVRDTEKPSDT
jgi:hypothetical protein